MISAKNRTKKIAKTEDLVTLLTIQYELRAIHDFQNVNLEARWHSSTIMQMKSLTELFIKSMIQTNAKCKFSYRLGECPPFAFRSQFTQSKHGRKSILLL